MTDVTIPGVPGVHPTFVLVNPSVDQVTTFQNYLATGLTGRISTTATLAEQSSRTYRITFSNVGSPGPYGARYFGYYLYHSNNGTWTVIHGASASDWGYIEINWDAMIVGGAIDPVRFAKAVSHEMGHTKYGPHIYEYVETWPFAVPPTGAQLAQDGQMSADATEAYLAGESLVLSDATNHAVLDINGLPIIYSKANGTSQAVFEAEYLNQWARAIERNWPRGPDGAYTTRAHIPPRNIVSHSPSELAGEATVKEAVGIISTGGNDYLIVLLKNTRMVVAGALQELQELADTILIAGEASLQVDTSDLLGTIGSVLGREFAGDNPIAQIAVSSALQSVLTNIGEWMEANGFPHAGTTAGGGLGDALEQALGGDLWATLGSQAVGAISSYLVGQFVDELGIEGAAGELTASVGSRVVSQIATNLLNGSEWSAGINPALFINAIGSWIGGRLAMDLLEPETRGGQIGAAVGQAYGGLNAARFLAANAQWAVANPILAIVAVAVIVFLDTIFGGLIGSLFGGTPKAGAALGWDAVDQRFEVGRVWSKNGGSKDAVRSMAGQVGELLNGVVAASGSRVTDAAGVQTGAYDQKGSRYIYKPSMEGGYAFSSKDISKAINHGAFIALHDLSERLIGGDVFVKRALSATLEQANGSHDSNGSYSAGDFDAQTLFGNLATAQDYASYRQNTAVINALIAAEPESAFTAGWTITFARVVELGLDRRWKSDWLGGWAAFLDETADGAIDGSAFAPGSVLLELGPETNERLFVFVDDDGALLGALGDTIDTSSKTIINATSANDTVTVSNDSWTETRAITDTVSVAADRSFFNRRTNSTFTIDPETQFQGAPIALGEGLLLTGADTVEVTREVIIDRTGWRITDATGLSVLNRDAAGGPAFETIASGPSELIRVAALIDGGAGNDVIRGGDLGNDLLGGEGNDTLIGGVLDDWQFGGAGNDRLFAGAVVDPNASDEDLLTDVDGGNGDYLDGGAGDDSLYGGRGSDWLNGGEGVDRLVAGAGGDILDGGAGDDRGATGEARLLGGAGSDQYVFYYGAGDDVVFDASDPASIAGTELYALSTRYAFLGANPGARNWAGNGDYEVDGSVVGGEDAISFGAGIGFEDLNLRRGTTNGVANSDLIIELTTIENGVRVLSGDTLTIRDWFDETRRVEWLRFADGQDVRIGDLSSFIYGPNVGSSIIGTAGSDWAVGLSDDDDMHLLAGDDFGFGAKGDDLIAGDGDNDFLSGGDGADQVMGGAGHDTVFGDAGADRINGDAGNDIVAGGRGDDVVVGGEGNDLYRFWRGDGHDEVFDSYASAATEIVYDGTDWVNDYERVLDGRILRSATDQVYDGTYWNVSLVWDPGSGELRRQAEGVGTANTGLDTFEFGTGIDVEDVQLMRVGDNLELAIGDAYGGATAFMAIADRITFTEWYTAPGQIERFVFTEIGMLDISTWNLGALVSDGNDAITGTAIRDWITGGLGDDVISGGDADDILSGNHGADRLSGGAGIDVLYGGADDDVLEGGAGADLIYGGAGDDIASYAGITGAAGVHASLANSFLNTLDAEGDELIGVEGLEGTNQNDELWGDVGDNTLRGLAGNDVLKGDGGDDTYEVNAGQGNDVIADFKVAIEEVIDVNGELRAGYDLNWEMIDVTDMWGGYWYTYQLTVTRESDGVVVYQSRSHGDFVYEDTVSDPPPASAWPFANGQWISGMRSGNGAQTIIESAAAGDAGEDTLEIGANVSLSDLTATRAGNDLTLAFASGGSVTVRDHYLTVGTELERQRAVEQLTLHDGLVANLANIRLGTEQGEAGDDLYIGGASVDAFAGGDGDDVISGGAGADALSGDAGDDTLEGGAGGDALDGGADSVTADHAALEGDTAGAYGDTIRYLRSSAGVIIDLALAPEAAAQGGDAQGDIIIDIENVVGSDGYGDQLYGDVGANRLSGMGGDDTLDGRAGDDVLIGGAGADTIEGGDGDDAITGDDGADTLRGGAGVDIIVGGDGADVIWGGAGNDRADGAALIGGLGDDVIHGEDGDDAISGDEGADLIYGEDGDDVINAGAGDDHVWGGAGDDTLAGGAGVDSLEGGAGNDTYAFDASAGVTQIIDAEGDANALGFLDVSRSQLWLAQVGLDLKISVIGSDTLITISNYFATTGGSRMRSIATKDGVLYLAHAGDFIAAMTALGVTAPAAMPEAIAALFDTFWETSEAAAPRVGDQSIALNEDGSASGTVSAIDPDDQALSYALHEGPAHGTLSFNTTSGAWTYQADADWNGLDGFDVAVTDADGQTSIETVTLNVAAVNDAPNIVAPTLTIAENAANGDVVGTLATTDVDNATPAIFTEALVADGRFHIAADGAISVANAALLDFEGPGSYGFEVTATDAGGLARTQTITIVMSDVNEAPTALAFANTVASLSEAISTANRVKLADLVVSDDALGDESFSLSGADAALFEVFEGALYLRAGIALNYEAQTSYDVTVSVDDASVGNSPDATQSFTLTITDANEAPTALAFNNVTSSLSDTLSTAARVHLADLAVSDDALGSESLTLTGADAASFEIYNGALYLRAGVTLNAGSQSTYNVTINVDDAAIGAGVELSQNFSLNVGAGLALAFANATTSLAENTSTSARVKVADLVIADDVGTPNLTLTGADAASFEIYNGALYLKAGVVLNYEAKLSYDVTVVMDEPSIGTGPELTRNFTLSVSNVNEAPTALAFTNTTTSLVENTSTASRIKLADLNVSDDALGTETFSLSGADAAFFEIIGSTLYLKAGVALNYEAKASYAVTVNVDDASVGASPDVAQVFTLTLSDANEAPSAFALTNQLASLSEAASTAARTKVADLNITDDALGSETITLSGADAASFEIYNGALYLRAGVALNFEAKTSYAVSVNVVDQALGGSPLTQTYTLQIGDSNEAPSAITFANTTTSLAENTSTSTRVKVADINVADDALGSEALTLAGADAALFEIIGGVLYLRAGTSLNYEVKSSYSVTVQVDDASVGGNPDAAQSFTLTLSDVNETPVLNWSGVTAQTSGASWNSGTLTLSVAENTAAGVAIGRLATTDPDVGTFANLRYQLTGANAGLFTINATTGDIALVAPLNFEASPNSFSVGVTVWDGGAVGSGLSASGTITIAAANINEAPVGTGFFYYYAGTRNSGTVVGTSSATDPEASAVTYSIYSVSRELVYDGEITTTTLANTTYTVSSGGVVTLATNASVVAGAVRTDTIVVRAADASGNFSYISSQAQYDRSSAGGGGGGGGGGGVEPPIVLDLNGDGVTLTSFADSTIEMDVNGDGVADPIGWIGADDGFLALDRNGDGVIAGIDEIRFSHDETGAASDLEGVRAYDTNANGFLDTGDAQFAEFRVWQDANQDGVAQAGEVTDLAARQVAAINLTLTLTGQSPVGATDNVLYGTTSYVRTDGTTGQVGDVFLYYVPTIMQANALPPIVFDLDGGGLTLTSRLQSHVQFDADNDGDVERIGWFGAGEGVLALDRNGDGLINSGAEISFIADVVGAQTDLQGLAAFDSNDNGFFDLGDDRFGDFRIWQDANQDGVSQTEELRGLAAWDIQALNLTPTLTGASLSDAVDNVIYATTQFVRSDGSRGVAGDVLLAFDGAATGVTTETLEDGGWCDVRNDDPKTAEDDDCDDRTADNEVRLRRRRAWARDRFDWINDNEVQDDGVDTEFLAPAREMWGGRRGLWGRMREERPFRDTVGDLFDGGADLVEETHPPAGQARPQTRLHHGLSLSSSRVLHMIDAMAGFDAQGASELARSSRQRDPRVAAMLTTLPDIR